MPRLRTLKRIPPELLEQLEDAPLAIPSPKVEHEHRINPYQSLPGAVPDPEEEPKRKRGRPRKDDALAQARAEGAKRLDRYHRYLDALMAAGGDQDVALSAVYGIENVQEAVRRRSELLEDLHAGIPASSTAELIARQDLSKAARLTILRKWMYSSNPAASLKSVDMVNEMDGQGPDIGSYEHYVRRHLQ